MLWDFCIAFPSAVNMTDRPAATQRFSDRVADYVRSRPSYASAVVDCLREGGALPEGARVADVGAGTGISSQLFLDAGCAVTAVEPNAAMREAAVQRLASPRFEARDGTGENSGLPDGGFDLVTVAQALHWMDIDRCGREFRRVLRPGGAIAVLFNSRVHDASPFMAGYEALVRRFSVDYEQVRHENLSAERFGRLFGHDGYRYARFENAQRSDWGLCLSRARSSSYLPAQNEEGHEDMVQSLKALFDQHADGPELVFHYVTELYWGRPGDESGIDL